MDQPSNTTTDRLPCPRCEGRKTDSGYMLVRRADSASCDMERYENRPCEMCAGVGSITARHARHIIIAKEYRHRRMAAYRDLQQEGERLGSEAVGLSLAERLGIGSDSLFERMALPIPT